MDAECQRVITVTWFDRLLLRGQHGGGSSPNRLPEAARPARVVNGDRKRQKSPQVTCDKPAADPQHMCMKRVLHPPGSRQRLRLEDHAHINCLHHIQDVLTEILRPTEGGHGFVVEVGRPLVEYTIPAVSIKLQTHTASKDGTRATHSRPTVHTRTSWRKLTT